MTERLLLAFVGEVRGYCTLLATLSADLREPDAADSAISDTARQLQQIAHTIARLSSSPEIEDIARLAEGMEACLLGLTAPTGAPQTSRLLDPLAGLFELTTGYFRRRLDAMEAAGALTQPSISDQELLVRLEETLLHLGNQLFPQDEPEAPPDESLSAEDLAIWRSFQEASFANEVPAPVPPARRPGGTPGGQAPEVASEADAIPLEMVQLFQVETREDLGAFQAALARLDAPEDRTASVLEMRRIVHKIKGAASTLTLQLIASLAHCLEDVLDLLRQHRVEYAPAVVDVLIHGLTELERAIHYPSGTEPPSDGLERVQAEYQQLVEAATRALAEDPAATQPDSRRLAAIAHQPETNPAERGEHSSSPVNLQRWQDGYSPDREHFLRVDARRLDQLIDLMGELVTSRAGTERARLEIVESVAELRPALQRVSRLIGQLAEYEGASAWQLDHTAERADVAVAQATQSALTELRQSRATARPAAASPDKTTHPLNPLLTPAQAIAAREQALELERGGEYDHLLRSLRESANDVTIISESLQHRLTQMNELSQAQDRLTTTIQRDLTHVRLVPLTQILPRLQLTARMIAQEQNKQILFQATGESTEIDRDIIEAISGPLVQLVRNCAAHGLESAEERRALGKPESGTIWLHAYYSGNEISIELGDDGRGIDIERLIETALALGKLTAEQAQALDPEEALSLILLPDISTSPEITTISGRGVGMDMVRSTVERLKGALHIHTTAGHGTTFHIRLPISLGILRALFVRANEQIYTVPFTAVERIALQASDAANDQTIFLPLPGLLENTPRRPDGANNAPPLALNHPALMIPLGQRQVGVLVDEVLAEREIVVKPLPLHLRRRGVRGVTITPTGQMLLLLDLPELAYRAIGGRTRPSDPEEHGQRLSARPLTHPLVMVVDDSLSMRRTLELQLTRAGYQVITAKDGLESLELLAAHQPNLLLLDIEMPQLDGYELLARLRRQPPFKHLPIAMLSSRGADLHRNHALELGADAYLVKPCPHDLLLSTVAELIKQG